MTTEQLETCPSMSIDDDLGHWACCRDDNRAFCGTDVTNAELNQDSEPNCVVCIDIHEWSGVLCPFDGRRCP